MTIAEYRKPITFGIAIATAGTILMLCLLGFGLLGPSALSSNREMIGGTVLFLMLYLFLLLGIYLVLKAKKEQNESRLSFTDALSQGFVLSVSTALTSVVFTYLFYEVLYPDYVNELLSALKENMSLMNIPADKINEKLLEKRDYYSTGVQAGYSFVGNLTTGAAFTFLLSFFLKTKS